MSRGRFSMILHLSYVPFLDFGFWISDFGFIDPKSRFRIRNSPLNLLYLNFRIILTVALFAFVLFTTLFLKNNDLFTPTVA